jgi:curved DNA-binding protein CbpA
MKKDYYSILGVTKDSTPTEIKAAYRKLALKFHPDKNPGDPFFEKMFIEVKEAYDVLTALHSKKEENSKSASSTTESTTKKAESQSNNSQFDRSQFINKIIKDLKELESRVKNKPRNQLKTEVIFEYLTKILKEDALRIIKSAHPQKREDVIFAMVPLLRFFSNAEREGLLLKIISIAGADNTLISQIDLKNKESVSAQNSIERKQAFVRIGKKIFEYRPIIIGLVIIGFIIYSAITNSDNSSSSNSRDVIVDDEPEISQKISKWVGNKLNTGDSPYNNYFGTGVYDSQYLNEVTVHNGQKTDVIVCLTEYENPYRTIRNEYIRAGESFKLTSVPNGLYSLKWFYGNNWNPDTVYIEGIQGFFDNDAGFSKSDSPSDLLKMEQNDKQYSTFEITLYSVQNGNMETKEINPNEFFKKN